MGGWLCYIYFYIKVKELISGNILVDFVLILEKKYVS
jgi:hypothetical protein